MSDILKNKKICFVGGGNMAQALISGLLGKGIAPKHITVVDPNEDKRQYLAGKGVNTTAPEQATDKALVEADVIVLAVKPQVMHTVVADFAAVLKEQLVISVAAGLSTQAISDMLDGYQNIVRAMPNTPAMIQMGATGMYAPASINETQKQLATEVMAASGLVLWVDTEEQLHAVTAVSGSAPAYVFYFIEAMIDAAQELGLERKQASALAMQTVLGAAQMSITSDDTPAQLRRNVTSPNGTTQAAIESMQANDVAGLIAQAMQACYKRSEQISAEMSSQK